jgi:hypothetical protein
VNVNLGSRRRVRFNVASKESTLQFEARSTLHPVHGHAAELTGYVEINADGEDALDDGPPPKMHVEFPVERLRSGNALQDREMWKLVNSKAFPRIAADLRDFAPASQAGRYRASGDITFVGRSRRYSGEVSVDRAPERITIDGELDVDIRDYNLRPPNLVVFKVEPVVRVRLHLVAKGAA